MTFVLIDETRPVTVEARVVGDAVRLGREEVATALGWDVTSQGLCRGDRCIPIPPGTLLVRDGGIDLATLAALLDRPLALDIEERAAALGAAAGERAARLASLEAPDFTLPDLDGHPHTLSAYRGRKVLLVAWASW